MPPLEDALARVPGLAGYLGQQQFQQQQQTGQLGQMGSLLKIKAALDAQRQEQELNQALKASGGDLERALPALIQAGHIKGEHLTAAMKLLSDSQSKREAIQAMRELNVPQSAQPRELGAGQPVAPEAGTPVPVQPAGNEDRISKLKMMQTQYAGNPSISTQIQKEIDKLEANAKPMIEHNFPIGNNKVQPHISLDQGKTWNPIPGSVASDKFNPNTTASPQNIETIADAIGTYKQGPLTGFALRSPGAQQIMSRVFEKYPQYDAKNFATAQQTMNNFSKGPQGNSVRSFNVALEHLDTLKDLTSALGNNDVKRINQLSQRVSEELGRAAPTNFEAAKQIIGEEIIKAVVTGGGGVTERQAAGERLSRANSPQQLAGVIDTYQNLLVGQLKGLKTQYEGGTLGRTDFEDRFLTARARELYKSKLTSTTSSGWTPEKEKRYQELKAQQNAP